MLCVFARASTYSEEAPMLTYQHSLAPAGVPPSIPVLVRVKLVHSVSLACGWPSTGVAVKRNADGVRTVAAIE